MLRVLAEAWATTVESAPYLLFGFLVAGLLHGLLSAEAVVRHLGKGRISSVVKAALFGIPLPLCSCGVLPAAVNLRRKGASRGAVLSFLVSTPETGVDSIALSWALLGPVMTVFRPLAAFATAVVAGVLENFSSGKEIAEEPTPACGCAQSPPMAVPITRRVREGLRYAFGDLLGDLAPWLGLGLLVAGLITAAVPEGFVERNLGGGWLSYLVMLTVGVPLYICATASTPVAAALLAKGLSPGAALVFLLAGPATNATSITALTGMLGGRTTVRYLLAIATVSVSMGALLDALWTEGGFGTVASVAAASDFFPRGVGTICAVLLLALFVRPFQRFGRPAPQSCSGAA
ncbi:MAG: SO_0444 family Cu/Zn efflux transporter [Deltaproteobacteria bacterium]|nr:SO_0444 family Cu/Zn efflux transporter [Deltaproteobacteria bacterium]